MTEHAIIIRNSANQRSPWQMLMTLLDDSQRYLSATDPGGGSQGSSGQLPPNQTERKPQHPQITLTLNIIKGLANFYLQVDFVAGVTIATMSEHHPKLMQAGEALRKLNIQKRHEIPRERHEGLGICYEQWHRCKVSFGNANLAVANNKDDKPDKLDLLLRELEKLEDLIESYFSSATPS